MHNLERLLVAVNRPDPLLEPERVNCFGLLLADVSVVLDAVNTLEYLLGDVIPFELLYRLGGVNNVDCFLKPGSMKTVVCPVLVLASPSCTFVCHLFWVAGLFHCKPLRETARPVQFAVCK